jgi:hypothetical protein
MPASVSAAIAPTLVVSTTDLRMWILLCEDSTIAKHGDDAAIPRQRAGKKNDNGQTPLDTSAGAA